MSRWSIMVFYLFFLSFFFLLELKLNVWLFCSYSGAGSAGWLRLPVQRQRRTVTRLFCNIRYSTSLSVSPYFFLPLSLFLSLRNTHTLHFSCAIFCSHGDTHTHTPASVPTVCNPAESSFISWYRAPSTGHISSSSAATQLSSSYFLLSKRHILTQQHAQGEGHRE